MPAVRRCLQAGPGASARQPAGRLASAGATKALRLKPRCSPAGHGCKAPSTNARTARPATWPSNGAPTAQPPANASALEVSVECCEEMITVEELTEDTVASQPLPAVSTPVHH